MYQSASCEVRPSHYIPLRPPSRCIYYPGIFRHREDEEGEGCEVDVLSSPLSLFLSAIYIFTPSSSFSCTCSRRQGRIRQRREGSACWIAEPRGVGARIKGAVRLEGAPNYDVTDRTRRDQVSRIQNGLLITESPLARRSAVATVAVTYYSPVLRSPVCALDGIYLSWWGPRGVNAPTLREAQTSVSARQSRQINKHEIAAEGPLLAASGPRAFV